jgi:hypothetical protein
MEDRRWTPTLLQMDVTDVVQGKKAHVATPTAARVKVLEKTAAKS